MTAAAPDVGVVSKKEPRRALRVTALGLILLSRAFSKMFVSICNRRLAEARPRSDCILAVTEVAEGGGGGGGDHCRLLWQKSAFHSDVLLYFSYGRGGHDADCREEREQQRGEEKREKRSTCGAFQARGAESEAAADDDKWRRFTILFFTLLGSKRERERERVELRRASVINILLLFRLPRLLAARAPARSLRKGKLGRRGNKKRLSRRRRRSGGNLARTCCPFCPPPSASASVAVVACSAFLQQKPSRHAGGRCSPRH